MPAETALLPFSRYRATTPVHKGIGDIAFKVRREIFAAWSKALWTKPGGCR